MKTGDAKSPPVTMRVHDDQDAGDRQRLDDRIDREEERIGPVRLDLPAEPGGGPEGSPDDAPAPASCQPRLSVRRPSRDRQPLHVRQRSTRAPTRNTMPSTARSGGFDADARGSRAPRPRRRRADASRRAPSVSGMSEAAVATQREAPDRESTVPDSKYTGSCARLTRCQASRPKSRNSEANIMPMPYSATSVSTKTAGEQQAAGRRRS